MFPVNDRTPIERFNGNNPFPLNLAWGITFVAGFDSTNRYYGALS